MPRTDLRELLGDRYDRTMGDAYVAFRARLIFNTAPNAIVADAIERALAAVLPDLLADARREGLADAWDEGHEAGWDDLAARSAELDLTDTPNPYRAAHAAELHDSTEPKGPTMPNNNTDVPPESWPFPPYVILNLGGESRTYWPRDGVPSPLDGPCASAGPVIPGWRDGSTRLYCKLTYGHRGAHTDNDGAMWCDHATPDAPRNAHSAAQGVPASQCGPDAARPADGIVSGTQYGTEGGMGA